MKNEEKENSNVDLSAILCENHSAVEGAQKQNGYGDQIAADNEKSEEDLMAEIKEADPVLHDLIVALGESQKMQQHLLHRIALLERHVGYLLEKDPEVAQKLEEADAAQKESQQDVESTTESGQ